MENDIWKDVPGHEGICQVSNAGCVRGIKHREEIIINPSINSGGYKQVGIWAYGNSRLFLVHQLVAMAFLNHKPCGMKLVINHKDFDKLNNHVDNLEIITQRENMAHRQIRLKSSSSYRGVYWNKVRGSWGAQIYYKNKQKNLGIFNTEYDAHLAYQKALKQIPII